MAAPVISPEQGAYAIAVAKGSGLSLYTVVSWVLGENGPSNNFLGVKDPATGKIGAYATPAAGAAAAVKVLHQPNMASVITTAQSTADEKAQLAAIANSPWDSGQVGPKPGYLSLLLGTFSSIKGSMIDNRTGQIVGAVPTTPDPGPSSAGLAGISNPLTSWVGDLTGWMQKEASLGLAYVVLTILGVAFVLFGALDTFGYSPGRLASAAKQSPDPIPF